MFRTSQQAQTLDLMMRGVSGMCRRLPLAQEMGPVLYMKSNYPSSSWAMVEMCTRTSNLLRSTTSTCWKTMTRRCRIYCDLEVRKETWHGGCPFSWAAGNLAQRFWLG